MQTTINWISTQHSLPKNGVEYLILHQDDFISMMPNIHSEYLIFREARYSEELQGYIVDVKGNVVKQELVRYYFPVSEVRWK